MKNFCDRPFGDENWRVGGSPHRQDEVTRRGLTYKSLISPGKRLRAEKCIQEFQCLLSVVFKYFYFDLYLWKIPNLANIFQRG